MHPMVVTAKNDNFQDHLYHITFYVLAYIIIMLIRGLSGIVAKHARNWEEDYFGREFSDLATPQDQLDNAEGCTGFT